MAYEDGIKIKITAEDDASAAFEKVRNSIVGNLREIDDAGGILSNLADGISTLGDEFGVTGSAASRFAGQLDKSAASATSLAAEIATMASGLKDMTTAGADIVKSGWFKTLFTRGGVASLLGQVGIGTGVAAGGAAALTVGGAAYGGLKLYENSMNEQQRRDAMAPVGLADRQFREFVGGSREGLGDSFINSVLNDPKLNRLKGFGGNQAYRDEVSKRITDEQNRRAAEQDAQKAQRDQQRTAATAERLRQADLQAKDQLGVAERLNADDPLKLLEMRLRYENQSENYIKFRLQQERDILKIEKDKATVQEKQLALAETRNDIDRRMGTSAEAWKERSMTDVEKRNRDELEVLGLMMSGRIGQNQYQRIMDSIAIDYTKPDAHGKTPNKVQLDLGGDNVYASRYATRGLNEQTSQLDLLRKLLMELKDGNHKQRLQAHRMEDLLSRGGIVLGVQGPI